MGVELNSRERVLKLFRKKKIDRIPVFSGMGNVTVHGLEKYGWKFTEIHKDAGKLASIAASTFQLFGFECAVVPIDMAVEAEALGAEVNFYPHRTDVIYPTILKKLVEKVAELDLKLPSELGKAGRIPLIVEAIRFLKEEVGDQVAIGAWVLGPYTLAGQIIELDDLTKMTLKKPEAVSKVLDILGEFLVSITKIYKNAGADYITVREMGACGDMLSPRIFTSLIKPHLQRTFAEMESPKVLHICGDTNTIVEEMVTCGADAISVDQKNNLKESRNKIGPDVILLGNLDPFNVLVRGKPTDIEKAVKEIIDSGANAVWPGCDIWPTVPKENMKALVTAVIKHGNM